MIIRAKERTKRPRSAELKFSGQVRKCMCPTENKMSKEDFQIHHPQQDPLENTSHNAKERLSARERKRARKWSQPSKPWRCNYKCMSSTSKNKTGLKMNEEVTGETRRRFKAKPKRGAQVKKRRHKSTTVVMGWGWRKTKKKEPPEKIHEARWEKCAWRIVDLPLRRQSQGSSSSRTWWWWVLSLSVNEKQHNDMG